MGSLTGFLIDFFIKKRTKNNNLKINLNLEEIKNKSHLFLYKLWLIIFIPGLFLGIINHLQIAPPKILNFDINYIFGFTAAFFSIFLWTINPFSDKDISLDRSREVNFKSIDLTNFVTLWLIVGFLFFDLGIYFTGLDFKSVDLTNFVTLWVIVGFLFFDLGIPFNFCDFHIFDSESKCPLIAYTSSSFLYNISPRFMDTTRSYDNKLYKNDEDV
jgi:hypothetical protein